MSVQTVLLDFSIDPVRIVDEIASKDLLKFIEQGLNKYFENLKFVYDLKTEDGYLCLFTIRIWSSFKFASSIMVLSQSTLNIIKARPKTRSCHLK